MKENNNRLLSLDKLSDIEAQSIRFILTDIDDTLTTDGRLTGEAYGALWKLQDAGIQVIPITGRPAGWCELIARQWPVAGVVGENGAFVFFQDSQGKMQRLYHPEARLDQVKKRLEILEKGLRERLGGIRIASDQFSRLFDLAIDFAEEEPALGLDYAYQVQKICEEFGAVAKVSSIHVNAWFGDYDKLSMSRLFLEQLFQIPFHSDYKEILFCGDSPNDEPMFSFFPLTAGVANYRNFIRPEGAPPRFLTTLESGQGFCQIVERLLKLKY